MVELMNGDCLELMKNIPDHSVDMVLCDLPYGTTMNAWDKKIDLDLLFQEYNRIVKQHGAIVLFSQMPYSAELVMANKKQFRYEWIWEKTMATGFMNANRMPMKTHENILIFYKKLPTYNPIMTEGTPYQKKQLHNGFGTNYSGTGLNRVGQVCKNNGTRYQKDIIKFQNSNHKSLHPTQKPVPLLEYLIKTYTNESDLVLDNCMGSGSTGVACINTNRNFVGIELDTHYFQVAKERIEETTKMQDIQ